MQRLAILALAALTARVNELSEAQGLPPLEPFPTDGLDDQPQTGAATAVDDLDSLTFRNGMSEPDEFGAVILEDLERRVRPALQADLEAKNLRIHQRQFVAEALDVWGDQLNDEQRAHIAMNTGDNARAYLAGRWGRAVKVAYVPFRGRYAWREVDTLPDHGTTVGPTAAEAVAEIEKNFRQAIKDAVDNGGTFTIRGQS